MKQLAYSVVVRGRSPKLKFESLKVQYCWTERKRIESHNRLLCKCAGDFDEFCQARDSLGSQQGVHRTIFNFVS